jgi:hypothetical protein
VIKRDEAIKQVVADRDQRREYNKLGGEYKKLADEYSKGGRVQQAGGRREAANEAARREEVVGTPGTPERPPAALQLIFRRGNGEGDLLMPARRTVSSTVITAP